VARFQLKKTWEKVGGIPSCTSREKFYYIMVEAVVTSHYKGFVSAPDDVSSHAFLR